MKQQNRKQEKRGKSDCKKRWSREIVLEWILCCMRLVFVGWIVYTLFGGIDLNHYFYLWFGVVYLILSLYTIKKKNKSIHSEKIVVRKASASSLTPSFFFADMLTITSESVIESEYNVISECSINNQTSEHLEISIASRNLMKDYIMWLQQNLKNSKKRDEIISKLSRRINVCKDAIKYEREAMTAESGSKQSDFVFTKQNVFSDLLLTSMLLPVVMEAIKSNEVSNLSCVWIENQSFRCFSTAFVVVLFYKVVKYYQNKRSMLRDNHRIALYYKSDFLLSIFEQSLYEYCELNNHKSEQ